MNGGDINGEALSDPGSHHKKEGLEPQFWAHETSLWRNRTEVQIIIVGLVAWLCLKMAF